MKIGVKIKNGIIEPRHNKGFPVAQITIEVPDELLPRLTPYQNRLSSVLSRWVASQEVVSEHSPSGAERSDIYREIIQFLLTQPDPQKILSFKVSDAAQERFGILLDKNRIAQLTQTEVAELDLYEQLDQLMRALKIQAFAMLKDRNQQDSA